MSKNLPKEVDPRFVKPHRIDKFIQEMDWILSENDKDLRIYDRKTIESFRLKT